jgi:hypothetical protein
MSFATTIKPYFTPCYRAHMLNYGDQFDLWDPAQVQQEWQPIHDNVKGNNMPAVGCPEGIWDTLTRAQFLADFTAWQTAGFPP